jgi:hypothetical protein
MSSEELHNAAMEQADLADAAMRRGKAGEQREHLLRAADLEQQAAASVPETMQPTHAILYRSAASLFFQLGALVTATELAKEGLKGDAPPSIASELRQMLRITTKEPWPEPEMDFEDKPKRRRK